MAETAELLSHWIILSALILVFGSLVWSLIRHGFRGGFFR